MDSAPDANNRKVVFQRKPTRERAAAAEKAHSKRKTLRRRGLISEKQMRRFGANEDR